MDGWVDGSPEKVKNGIKAEGAPMTHEKLSRSGTRIHVY